MLAASPLADKLIATIGQRKTSVFGGSMAVLGLVVMTFAVAQNFIAIAAATMILVVGVRCTMSSAALALMGDLPEDQTSFGAALNDTPKQQASASLNWKPAGGFSGYVRAIYYGEEQQAALAISASNIIAPDYTTVDVGGSYIVNDKVTLRAGVQNLFNHEMTYEDYGYVNDKARVWAGLTARF